MGEGGEGRHIGKITRVIFGCFIEEDPIDTDISSRISCPALVPRDVALDCGDGLVTVASEDITVELVVRVAVQLRESCDVVRIWELSRWDG